MALIDKNHQLPQGLGMRLALDMEAMTNFVHLSDERKNELVGYIESSATGDEAKNRVAKVISSLHTNNYF
jgi:hypothetical protein